MADQMIILPRPRQMARKMLFSIVASQYNHTYVQGLVDAATNELYLLAPTSQVILHQAPGAYEIPVLVQELAIRRKPDVIIAMGVIIQGETPHADLIARCVTNSLQQIALEQHIPVLDAVLYVTSREQAEARCLSPTLNRGTEAAQAATSIASIMSELKS